MNLQCTPGHRTSGEDNKVGGRKSYREEPQTQEDNKSKGQWLRTDKHKQKENRVKCVKLEMAKIV